MKNEVTFFGGLRPKNTILGRPPAKKVLFWGHLRQKTLFWAASSQKSTVLGHLRQKNTNLGRPAAQSTISRPNISEFAVFLTKIFGFLAVFNGNLLIFGPDLEVTFSQNFLGASRRGYFFHRNLQFWGSEVIFFRKIFNC